MGVVIRPATESAGSGISTDGRAPNRPADWSETEGGDVDVDLLTMLEGQADRRSLATELDGPHGFETFPDRPSAPTTQPVAATLRSRVPALDGLRGLAAVAVVVFHLGYMNGGWLAVDLFFTLSGFLITTLLVREWGDDDRIRLGGFWGRRARRLLPALAVLLALVAVLTFITGAASAALHKQAWSTALYVSNWTAVFSPETYWEIFSTQSPLEHTWSLAIEEQFYLVWPLLCFVVLRVGKGRVAALAATTGALLAASLGAMLLLYSPGDDTNRVYFGTDTRAASILVGALLACWLARRPHHVGVRSWRWDDLPARRRAGRFALEALAIVAMVAMVAAWATTEGTNPLVYRGGLFLHAIGAALIIAAAVHPVHGVIRRGLSTRLLVWLGVISYGLYLFHWPVIWWLTPERTGQEGWVLALIRVAVTLAIATLSWYLVERHVLRGRVKLVAALPIVAVAAVVAVVVVQVTPTPAQPGNLGLVAANGDDTLGTKAAFSLPAAPPPTTAIPNLAFPPPQPAYRVLFAGDSVPYSIAKNWQPDAEKVVTGSVAIPSCDGARGGRIRFPLNMYVQDRPDCQGWAQLWPDALALFKPDSVVLMLGTAAIQERQVDGVYTQPCQSRYNNWYAGELDVRLSLLEQHMTGPILLALSPYADDRSIGVLPANHRQRTDCLNAIYREVGGRHAGVQVVDFADWVCPGGTCRTEIDGQPFRPDGLHLSAPAAAAAGDWLVEHAKLVGLGRMNAASTTTASGSPPDPSTSTTTTDATGAPGSPTSSLIPLPPPLPAADPNASVTPTTATPSDGSSPMPLPPPLPPGPPAVP